MVISLMVRMARMLRSSQNTKKNMGVYRFASFVIIRAFSFSFPRSFNLFVH